MGAEENGSSDLDLMWEVDVVSVLKTRTHHVKKLSLKET